MRERVISLLTDLHPEYDFTENVNFFEEGYLDSFDLVSLIALFEDEFNIKINGEDVIPENFESIDKMLSMIQSKL